MKRMADAGYNHYEISNYALPGKESRHNSSYWKGDAYLGLGPSAHSFDGQRTRRWNLSNNSLYIESLLKGVIPYEEEVLLDEQLMNEYIMTSLRTKEGISLAFIRMRFGAAHVNRLIVSSEKFNAAGRMRIHQDHLQLTDEGKLFADGIAADLFV
jgi:oxygen-independent coproporphyrinogen-3 oxidase